MNNNHHLSRDEIFPRVEEHPANEDHLKTCEQCNELVNILKHARDISHNLKPDDEWVHPSTLQLSETITKIYENSISGQEAANFINHVESCSLCFNYVAMTVEEALTPVPENVLQEIKVYNDISLAEMVLKKIPPEQTIFQKILKKIKKSFEKIIDEIGVLIIPKPDQPRSVFSPAIRIAVPVSLVAAIAFTIFFLPTAPSAYVYDNDPPFPYRSGFRSASSSIDEDRDYTKFHNDFPSAAMVYMDSDYENYIRRMANLESIAFDLKTKPLKKDKLDEIRDFYFYLGVSHFALSRSETRDLAPEQRVEHNRKAVQFLREAQSISKANILKMKDRDVYFLGLSYGFGSKPDSAILHFMTLDSTSSYYQEGLKLTEEWSNSGS